MAEMPPQVLGDVRRERGDEQDQCPHGLARRRGEAGEVVHEDHFDIRSLSSPRMVPLVQELHERLGMPDVTEVEGHRVPEAGVEEVEDRVLGETLGLELSQADLRRLIDAMPKPWRRQEQWVCSNSPAPPPSLTGATISTPSFTHRVSPALHRPPCLPPAASSALVPRTGSRDGSSTPRLDTPS